MIEELLPDANLLEGKTSPNISPRRPCTAVNINDRNVLTGNMHRSRYRHVILVACRVPIDARSIEVSSN